MIEVQAKEFVGQLLSNEILHNLIWTKRHDINPDTFIELEGDLSFTISNSGDRLLITLHDILPKITTKVLHHLIKLNGRLSTISIGQNDIILGLVGLPDQKITLT